MRTLPALAIAVAATTFTTNAAHVQFDLRDFVTGNISRRTIYIKPAGTPFTNANNQIITADARRHFTDVNGQVIVSNMQEAVYTCLLSGPETNTWITISVPDFAGLTNAAAILTDLTGVSDIAGYTIAQANAKFVLRNNGWASNVVVTNLMLPGYNAAVDYVWTCTNATTGAGHWVTNSAGGGSGGTTNYYTNYYTVSTNLNGLTDVNAPSPSQNNVLKYVQSEWVNGTLNLDDINDLILGTPTDLQYLRYWSAANVWTNDNLPTNSMTQSGIVVLGTNQSQKVWKTDTNGIPAWRDDATTGGGLDDLSDVRMTGTPAASDVLTFFSTGSYWSNAPTAVHKLGVAIPSSVLGRETNMGFVNGNSILITGSNPSGSNLLTIAVGPVTGTGKVVQESDPNLTNAAVYGSLNIPAVAAASDVDNVFGLGIATNEPPYTNVLVFTEEGGAHQRMVGTTTEPTDGQSLIFDLTSGRWIPATLIPTNANTLYLRVDGSDATAVRGNSLRPWRSWAHAVSNMTDGDTLKVSAGDYITALADALPAAALQGKSRVSIIGEGQPQLWFTNQENGQAALMLSNCMDVVVKGLTFNFITNRSGTIAGDVTGILLYSNILGNITIEDCRFNYCPGNVITHEDFTRGTATNVVIRGNSFYACGHTNSGATDINGSAIAGIGSGWEISHNLVWGSARGFEIEHTATYPSWDIIITDNRLIGVFEKGIFGQVAGNGTNTARLIITDNIISAWRTNSPGSSYCYGNNFGISLQGSDAIIANNLIENVLSDGVQVWSSQVSNRNVQILGNRIFNVGAKGIKGYQTVGPGVWNLDIQDNLISRTTNSAVEVAGNNVRVIDNRIENASLAGTSYGVYVISDYAPSTNMVIRGNHFVDDPVIGNTTDTAIQINEGYAFLSDNFVGHGITPLGVAAGVTVVHGIMTNDIYGMPVWVDQNTNTTWVLAYSSASNQNIRIPVGAIAGGGGDGIGGSNTTGTGAIVLSNAPSIYNPTIIGDATVGGSVNLYATNGVQYVSLLTPITMPAVYNLLLPSNAPSGGQTLYATNASNLVWVALPTGGGGGAIGVGTNQTSLIGVGTNLFFVNAGNMGITVSNTSGTNHVFLSAPDPVAGSETLNSLTVTQKFRLKETNIVVGETTPIVLNLATWNIFKLRLLTNCQIVFSNQEAGVANALVYFQQDTQGGHQLIAASVAGGILQTNTPITNGLTTTASALDLLEVKSGYYGTNLLAYWPQNFLPAVAAPTDFGQVRFSNSAVTVGDNIGSVTNYVMRTNGSEGPISVGVYQIAGTAGETDYLTNYTLLTWAHGNTDLKAVTVVITNDADGTEYFTNYLTDVVNATMTPFTNCTVTVTNDEAVAGLSTNGLVAWYDFADVTDAHAAFDLIDTNTPTYEAGPPSYGIGSSNQFWYQPTLGASFCPLNSTNQNWSWEARVQLTVGTTPGSYLMRGNGNYTKLTHVTTGNGAGAAMFSQDVDTTLVMTSNVWYHFVCVWDTNSMGCTVYTNGVLSLTTNQTIVSSSALIKIGSVDAATGTPAFYDRFSFWNKALSADDAVWLYNTNGTRTYSELTQ